MTYKETIKWMFERLPMYQREGKTAYRNKLDNIIFFSEYLSHPEKKFKSIHIAGTNGKGSTSHMLASIFQEAGYKVGLYTSPHLKDFRERIRINGKKVTKRFVVRFIKENKDFLEQRQLSFFEMSVGMAFAYFAKQKVAIAVIEVGLGGRLDSTNIITPQVVVITNIGYDHTDILGDTLAKIAYEKAGIIKSHVPVVISEYQEETYPVFEKIAAQQQSPLILANDIAIENYKTDLSGHYQAKNIKGVIAALRQMKGFSIGENAIKKGLLRVVKNTKLQGRWQQLHNIPKVICDTAHNKEGLELVFNQIKQEKFDKLHIVFGVVKDKNLDIIFPVLPKEAYYYFCSPDVPRGLSVEELQKKARLFEVPGDAYKSVSEAYKAALKKAAKNDFIYIGGSTFVVAEVV